MKNRLLGLSTLLFASLFAVNSFAECPHCGDGMGMMGGKYSGMSEEEKEAYKKEVMKIKEQCASQCNIDKDEVIKCQKEHKSKDSSMMQAGSCFTDRQKTCMRDCLRDAKEKHMQQRQEQEDLDMLDLE